MSRLKSELEVTCPCCQSILVIDLNLGRVISHHEPERTDKRKQQRSRAERRCKDPEPLSAVPGRGRHSYATHDLPEAVVESVNRGENKCSQSVL